MTKKFKKKRKHPQDHVEKAQNTTLIFHKIKKKYITNHLFLISFFVILFLFVIVLMAFVPKYQTNDDIGMSWVASGTGIVDQPDEHLLYQNVLLGLLLKKLYTAASNIPWYGLYHIFIHFIYFF